MMADYYERTTEQQHTIYVERERSWNVLRFFIALPVMGAVIAIFDHWYRTMIQPALTPTGTTPQAVVPVDVSCLYVLFVISALFLAAVMVRAIGRARREMRESRLEKTAHNTSTKSPMPRRAVSVDVFAEEENVPVPSPMEAWLQEQQERKELRRKRKEEQSWRKQERRGIMKPALMSNADYFSKVWTKEEIQEWMRVNGGGWE